MESAESIRKSKNQRNSSYRENITKNINDIKSSANIKKWIPLSGVAYLKPLSTLSYLMHTHL